MMFEERERDGQTDRELELENFVLQGLERERERGREREKLVAERN